MSLEFVIGACVSLGPLPKKVLCPFMEPSHTVGRVWGSGGRLSGKGVEANSHKGSVNDGKTMR